MARKKLNIKFIIILGVAVVVVAGGVVGLIYGKELLRPSIASIEKKGDEALAAGDYDAAAEHYGRAASRAKTDIPLQIKFVDAFDYTVRGDPEAMRKLRGYYNTIAQTDPNNVEIMRRLLRVQTSDAKAAPEYRPLLRALEETANRLIQLVPGDRDARKAKIITVLEPYQRNQEVPAEAVSDARDDAEKLYEEDPNDGETILMLVRFRLKEARDAALGGDKPGAAAAMDGVKKLVDDAMKKTPENAEAFFAAFNTYRALGTLGFDKPEDVRRGYLESASKFLKQADSLAQPSQFEDEERFLNIRAFAIRQIELADRTEAEKRYRQLVEEVPNNRWPRLLLSQFLSKMPNRAPEAIASLEAQWQPTKPLRAIESMQQESLRVQEKLRLSAIRLAAVKQMPPADRDANLQKVEALYNELAAIPNPQGTLVPWLRRIQGGIALERGKVSEAIERLDEALKLLPADATGQSESEIRNEVLLEYASAHLRLNQTGKARPALEELVGRDPLNMNALVMLIQVLQADHHFQDSEKRLQMLERYLGKENAVVQTLWNKQFDGREDLLRDRYSDMPETTAQQIMIKIDAAGRLGNLAEQERLARAALAMNPKNTQLSLALSQMLMRQDKREEALAVLLAAEKEAPENAQIKAFREQIAAETPEEQRKLLERRVQDIADPYQRELTRAELERLQGNFDSAIQALKKAEAIDPKDTRAVVAQFELQLANQKVEEARQVYDKLRTLPGADDADLETRRIRLMVAEAATGDPEQTQQRLTAAMAEAAKVAQRYPEIAGPSLVYARLLQDTGSYSEALEQYQQVLDKQPSNIDAARGTVASLVALARYPEARTRLQAARNLAPNDESLRQMELQLELEHGDPRRVVDTLVGLRDKNPTSPQAWAQLGYALERVASFANRKKDTQTATEFQARAVEMWKAASEKFPADLRFTAAYADSQRRAGNPSAAEAAVEKLYKSPEWSGKPEAVELLATQYQQSNKPQEAEQVLRQFLANSNPVPTSTLLKLALLYIDQQRIQDALAVLDVKKEDPDIRRTRIELLVMAGDLEAARRAVEEALAEKPSPDLNLLAGFIALRSGKWEQADGFLATVLAERPTDSAALFYRAQVRLNSVPPNATGASDDLQRVISLNPGNIEARLVLSDLLMRQNERDRAIRQLEAAWKFNSSSKPVLLRLVDAYLGGLQPRRTEALRVIDTAQQASPQLASDPDVLLAEANVQLALNQPRKGVELAKQALAVSPDNAALQQRYFDTLLRAGATRDLIKESEPILEKDRGAWWLYQLRGVAYRRLEQRAEALREFDAAFNLVSAGQNEAAITQVVRTLAQTMGPDEAIKRLDPLAKTDTSARLLLANLYQQANNPGKSLEVLERVRTDLDRLRPDQRQQLLQSLGTTYLQVTPPDPAKAREAYIQLHKETPDDMLLLNNLAYVNTIPESGGSIEEALVYSTKAFQIAQTRSTLDVSVQYVYDTHGWVLVKSGKVSEGLELLRKAAEQAKFPDVFLHLAEAYMLQSDVEQAERALADARVIIESMETQKLAIDPMIRPKFERLSAEVDERKAAAPMGAAQ